jgi:hypothetical protein
MSDDTTPNFNVYVKFKANQSPPVSIQDRSGKGIGKIDVTQDSTVTFVQANGSDPFYFVGFYAQTTPITACPAPGSSPSYPNVFQVTLEPMRQASQMVVEDSDVGPPGSTTTYYYAVQISTQDANPTYYWSDPEIVNHSRGSTTKRDAVAMPADAPDAQGIGRSAGGPAPSATSSAPPPV